MAYIAMPDNQPPTEDELRQMVGLLLELRMIRRHGGWGELRLVVKNNQIANAELKLLKLPGDYQEIRNIFIDGDSIRWEV